MSPALVCRVAPGAVVVRSVTRPILPPPGLGCGQAWIGTILSINVIKQAGGDRNNSVEDGDEGNATRPDPARRRSHWPGGVTALLGMSGAAGAMGRRAWRPA